ncbi:SERTA domain-containing protein 1 [Rhea pennata]|uniref:SERTA domain-containing protein 1 n=1 Tax=Rhea pennata TaxID=8795 RepID=UPI002E26E6C5
MLAKGVKRKHSEMEAGGEPVAGAAGGTPAPAAPSDSLFNISMLKLHQSLRHVEPNLRYLVLVANTLRRIQDQMPAEAEGPLPPGCPPASPEPAGGPSAEQRRDGGARCPAPEEELLLSSWDASLCASLSGALEGMGPLGAGAPDPTPPADEAPRDGALELGGWPDAPRPPHPFFGPLELLSSTSSLLEDSLEGIFEDIDTSMYDCDVWSPTSLAGFKAFSGADEEGEDGARLDMNDLDYLMDVLVGTHAL